MALASGAHIGSYEILSSLDAGGMGEVYRARDRKLKRTVAIRILPEALATDLESIARSERAQNARRDEPSRHRPWG